VAGFYDPDSTALFVMQDQPAETLRSVLVHELVHAVQDQAVDLDSLTARERGNDRQTAAQAAIEGHATLVMLEYAMEEARGRRVDLTELEGFGDQIRVMMGGTRADFPALASAPRVLQEALLFPYLEGAAFVQRVWRHSGDRAAPLMDELPQSTEQVLDPERLIGPDRDDPQDVEIRVPGATVLYEDVLGQLEIRLFVEELSGERGVPGTAEGWAGDLCALVEGPTGDALVWVLLWDDPGRRDAFRDRISPHLGRLPVSGRLESVDVDGVPGLLLRIGDVGEVQLSLARGVTGGGPHASAPVPSAP
jgi:hypothetical protein